MRDNNLLNINVNSLLELIADKDKDIKSQQDFLATMLKFVPTVDNISKSIKLNMQYLKFFKLQSNNNVVYWKHTKYDYYARFDKNHGIIFNIKNIIINAYKNHIIINKDGKIKDFQLHKTLYTNYLGLTLIVNNQGFFIYKHNINIFRYNYYNNYTENNKVVHNYGDIYFKLYDDVKHYCYCPYGLKIKNKNIDFFIDVISSATKNAELKLVHINDIYYTTISYNIIVKNLKLTSYCLFKRITKNTYYSMTVYKKGLFLNICNHGLLIPYDREGKYVNSSKDIIFQNFNSAMEDIEYNFEHYHNICKNA